MKSVFWILIVVSFSLLGRAQNQDAPTVSIDAASQDTRVFRDPFTLRLRVDKSHYYEERYEKRVPYVSNNDVYLFMGENFGVNLIARSDGAADVTYQPDIKKADVWFNFTQPKELGAGMMLTVQNKLKQKLQVEGLMKVPGKEGIFKTSVLPIEAGLSDFESWPHPIVQLVLRNFRLSESQLGERKH